MGKFEVGDRVAFNQDYYSTHKTGTFYTGVQGTVTDVHDGLVNLLADDGRATTVFEYRLNRASEPSPSFLPGREPAVEKTREEYLNDAAAWLSRQNYSHKASVSDVLDVAQFLRGT